MWDRGDDVAPAWRSLSVPHGRCLMSCAARGTAVTAQGIARAGAAGRPRKRGRARWTRLAGVDQEEVAPPTGGHRSGVDGEVLQRREPVTTATRRDMTKGRGEGGPGVHRLTLSRGMQTPVPEEGGARRNRRFSPTAGVGERGPWRRLRRPPARFEALG
jgi:hypothetical protein